MCIDKSYFLKARELFKEYGYTELNTQYDDCLVFLLDGMYPCIELISSESGEKHAESLKKDYKEIYLNYFESMYFKNYYHLDYRRNENRIQEKVNTLADEDKQDIINGLFKQYFA